MNTPQTLPEAPSATGLPARALLDQQMTEKQLAAAIVCALRHAGWLVWFTYRSTHSPPGEPDIRAARPPRYCLIELKTERGILTPHQRIAAEALRRCPGVEYYEIRPRNLDAFLWVTREEGED